MKKYKIFFCLAVICFCNLFALKSLNIEKSEEIGIENLVKNIKEQVEKEYQEVNKDLEQVKKELEYAKNMEEILRERIYELSLDKYNSKSLKFIEREIKQKYIDIAKNKSKVKHYPKLIESYENFIKEIFKYKELINNLKDRRQLQAISKLLSIQDKVLDYYKSRASILQDLKINRYLLKKECICNGSKDNINLFNKEVENQKKILKQSQYLCQRFKDKIEKLKLELYDNSQV